MLVITLFEMREGEAKCVRVGKEDYSGLAVWSEMVCV